MENIRVVEDAVASVIRENLASVDLSQLWSDIQQLNDVAILHVKELLNAYFETEQRAVS